jgi:hypothetical protein
VNPNPIADRSEEDLLWKNEKLDGKTSTIDNEAIDDGIIQIISAGYGSKHDGNHLILAICDECISKKLDDGTILFFYDYIFPHEEYIKDSIDRSKQIYRRRKNLDRLT